MSMKDDEVTSSSYNTVVLSPAGNK